MSGINDIADFNTVKKALNTLEFSEQEQADVYSIIAAILHLGNVTFMEEEGVSTILKPDLVENVSKVNTSSLDMVIMSLIYDLL